MEPLLFSGKFCIQKSFFILLLIPMCKDILFPAFSNITILLTMVYGQHSAKLKLGLNLAKLKQYGVSVVELLNGLMALPPCLKKVYSLLCYLYYLSMIPVCGKCLMHPLFVLYLFCSIPVTVVHIVNSQ